MEFKEQKNGVIAFLNRDPARSKCSFAVSHAGQLVGGECAGWLNERAYATPALNPVLMHAIQNGTCRAVNMRHPQSERFLNEPVALRPSKHRVHILAMGDVGMTLLMGLVLLGGDIISEIGISDMREPMLSRLEMEMNQICVPFSAYSFPPVIPIEGENLFDCDAFVFCASAVVPPLGSNVSDVRLAQLDANAGILKEYVRLAREQKFQGIFAVVSDPVDLLCQYAFYESSRNAEGVFDWQGLLPEQIRGYGLGVMNARAQYYAKKDDRFSSFLREGRSYGPHGQGLLIANSTTAYDDALSMELTELALHANLRVRELGYKPYIAPALSSGALSLLSTLRGEWHYSAVFLDGVFFGCKNRETPFGTEIEYLPLDAKLQERIESTYRQLWEKGGAWR